MCRAERRVHLAIRGVAALSIAQHHSTIALVLGGDVDSCLCIHTRNIFIQHHALPVRWNEHLKPSPEHITQVFYCNAADGLARCLTFHCVTSPQRLD